MKRDALSSSVETVPHGTPTPALVLALVLTALLTVAWIAFMLPDWWHNPDLSHGLISPILAMLLILEARARGVRRFLDFRVGTTFLFATTLLASLAVLFFAGLMAAALAWSNALTAFLLGAGLSGLFFATLLVCAQKNLRLIPFAWPAFVACLLPLLSAPIPPGSYSRLTLALQLGVTRWVLATLHLLGIPAQQVGNVIELATTRVGVEDACSGIRSLISCLVAALFFSGTLVSHPRGRFIVIALAAPLALAMNFLRSLALTLAADRGVAIDGVVHDASGYVGLALCAAALAGLAQTLEGKRPETAPSTVPPSPSSPRGANGLAIATSAAMAIVGFFAVKTLPLSPSSPQAPDLAAALPLSSPGWTVETDTDLYRFGSTLKTQFLAQRTYLRTTAQGTQQLTVYVAYWLPGQAPVSLVTSHTPDACWPGVGWIPVSNVTTQTILPTVPLLPPAEYRTFTQGKRLQHVWFWHLYDREPIAGSDPFSPFKMAGMVMRYGVRSEADQLFVRFSSNVPWSTLASEPLLQEIVDRMRTLGL